MTIQNEKSTLLAAHPGHPEPREALLYEHDDGRYAVAPSAEDAHFTRDEPAWHRLGPVAVYGSQPEAHAEVTAAVRDVLAERRRQVTVEGWTPDHDDEHANSKLAMAGACYATTAVLGNVSAPMGWPWTDAWFKPTTPRRNLVKAGALILAAIERLDRDSGDESHHNHSQGGDHA